MHGDGRQHDQLVVWLVRRRRLARRVRNVAAAAPNARADARADEPGADAAAEPGADIAAEPGADANAEPGADAHPDRNKPPQHLADD